MKPKWRPSLGLVVFAVFSAVMAMPLVGLFLFRLYDNQLIRQTEQELIAQGATLSALFAAEVEAKIAAESGRTPLALGAPEPPPDATADPAGRYHPVPATLDLARDDRLPPRPDAVAATTAPDPRLAEIGQHLAALAAETQKTTLTGFRILDPQGVVIGGREEMGRSLAGVDEVAAALAGRYKSVLRQRIPNGPEPALSSISRGAHVRVFAAMPVFVDDRVAGVVYLSRTPSNILESLYAERRSVLVAALTILLVTMAIGYVFLRILTRPIHELIRRTAEIQSGDRSALRPLVHHGTREIALLSQSFLDMAESLFDRSDYIATFTAHVSHELKSPLTSIQGAAELLYDNAERMTEAERRKFLRNIMGDAQRLATLVRRLRELAKADNPELGGTTNIGAVIARLREVRIPLAIATTGDATAAIGISEENAAIVLSHLADNAAQHGATGLHVHVEPAADRVRITVSDDGTGISEGNRARIFDAHFTTRRENGGTGMGLSIVCSMLRAHRGGIRLVPSRAGSAFEILLPKA
ncbi:two-component sensor histidine kinase [Aliidongia dinghuensis]|uniref:histidine kinase n=1 Tax=Aliidongia dinghuensis TaxID=1867774 RepID=A0A8J2YTG6_9PROT|nr:HAMP domain-containing sensor histidine kinase [Aliidongia dinghuensis]GGF19524.1 two-component sensor histidine kinase [Aliidongia dinghuensis]